MDGYSHINIYSQGKTTLGRNLSNFAATGIDTIDGPFNSIEGYWYWLGAPEDKREILRNLSGAEAKKVGRNIRALDWQDGTEFKLKIWSAMLTKLLLHPNILSEFQKNKLPFRHYYIMSGKVIEPKEGQWIIDLWEFLRSQLCT